MISKKQTFIFLGIYIFLRLFSYLFQPGNLFNTILSAFILLAAIYLLLRNDERGWYIIAAEILLGGTDSFLAIHDTSLRTLLLIASAIIFVWQKIKNKKVREIINANKIFCAIVSVLYIWLSYAAINGCLAGHNLNEIKVDIIPYLFLFYYFPLAELIKSEKFKKTAFNLLAAAIFGNLIFILFTFIGYSSELLHLQDAYYHWFRDIANGKITGFDFNFYRIILNEQLLLIPILLYFIWRRLNQPKKIDLFLSLSLIIILAINFTRVYIIALPIGLLFLFTKAHWKKWLAYSAGAMIIFFLSFTLIHTAANRGQSLGWEFFGIRLQSIAAPQIEDSSLSRLILLPKILEKIKAHPLLGNGLGDTVTAYSPVEKQTITTPEFDWGYLQMIEGLGAVGALIWLVALTGIFYVLIKSNSNQKRGLLASLAALLVINVTSPALFHVLGIIWMTFILGYLIPQNTHHTSSHPNNK